MKRHQGYFYCKSLKKTPPLNIFTTFRKSKMSQLFVICCSSSSILNLQICSFYFSCTTSPLPNQQKYRKLSTLIQHVKSNLICSCKTSKQKCSKTKKQCVKRITMFIYSCPTTQNSQRHLKCCLLYHPLTLSIQTKFQRNSEKTTPTLLKTNKLTKSSTSTIRKRRHKSRPLSHTL
jgi:hypothetical protein